MSKEIKILEETFIRDTGLTPMGTIEERDFPHWKRLVLPSINYDTMQKICYFIRKNFTVKDKFTHNLPTVHSFKNYLVITVDVELIKKHLMS